MKKANILKWYKHLCIAVISIFLFFGCAGRKPITPESVTPSDLSISKNYNDSVSIHVANGREFNAMGLPKLSNETLKSAVQEAIKASKLFSEIRLDEGGYRLDLYIVNISQPYAGSEMTVGVEIAWALKETSTNTVVWKQSIQTKK